MADDSKDVAPTEAGEVSKFSTATPKQISISERLTEARKSAEGLLFEPGSAGPNPFQGLKPKPATPPPQPPDSQGSNQQASESGDGNE